LPEKICCCQYESMAAAGFPRTLFEKLSRALDFTGRSTGDAFDPPENCVLFFVKMRANSALLIDVNVFDGLTTTL